MTTWINFLIGFILILESTIGTTIPLSSLHFDQMKDITYQLEDKQVAFDKPSSLNEKVGQLFIIGISGTSLTANEKAFIEEYKPGGVLLFSRNIQSVDQVSALIKDIKSTYPKGYLPPFIAIDEEGGIVSRLPNPYNITPSARQLGSNYNSNELENYASSLGLVLRSIGFNLDFAPVLDINSNPINPIVGSRAFSDEPIEAFNKGYAFYSGLKKQHVLGSMKHFPGHGDTSTDSHYGLPVLEKSQEEMVTSDMLPFLMAIENKVDAIMVGHLLWLDKDNTYPASLSKLIITDYLRDDLGYNGLVFTDDLEMGAVSKTYTVTERVNLAFSAGNDMLLMVHSLNAQKEGIEAVLELCKTDEGKHRLQEAQERIYSVKEQYLHHYILPTQSQIDQWFYQRIK